MRSSTSTRAFVAALASAVFLWTLALSASPQLHERIHPDANRSDHSCAVTLIASGHCNHSPAAPVLSAPVPVFEFSQPIALNSVWIRPQFLSSHLFAHAPPAHSWPLIIPHLRDGGASRVHCATRLTRANASSLGGFARVF